MPSLKAIRKRISSVKNTQKITKAMKVVAAAKLRRVQENVHALRPYARRMQQVVTNLAAHSEEQPEKDETKRNKLLFSKKEERVLLLAITSDRGLAGSFNTSVSRRVEKFLRDTQNKHVDLAFIGKKVREYFQRSVVARDENGARLRVAQVSNEIVIRHEFPGIDPNQVSSQARALSQLLLKEFHEGLFDAVYVAYNEAKTAASYTLQVKRVLPLFEEGRESHMAADFVYEPGKDEILEHLLPLHVEIQIQRILLESSTAEFRARMMAMDNASRNAKEMISRLTLQFNRARQASITKELMEIVGGAEALKG